MDPELKRRIPILGHPESFPYETEIYNESPPVVRIKGILTADECKHIIELSRSKLNSSTMVIGGKEVVGAARSSRSAFLIKSGEHPTTDPVIYKFLRVISELSGFPVNHFEGMKVVNYLKGQEYQAHFDFFRGHDNFIGGTGDRMLTFFVYLSTLGDKDGGETSFPKLGIKSKAVAGDAVFWCNMDFRGNYFENTLHAGEMVLGNTEKWGVNLWVRQYSY